MKILYMIFLLFMLGCNNSNESLEHISNDWIEITETDSGFINKTHYDNGMVLLRILNNDTLQLMADDKLSDFEIKQIKKVKDTIYLKCILAENNLISPEIIFCWKDEENEISEWTFIIENDTVYKSYFSSKNRIEKYPVVIYGE